MAVRSIGDSETNTERETEARLSELDWMLGEFRRVRNVVHRVLPWLADSGSIESAEVHEDGFSTIRDTEQGDVEILDRVLGLLPSLRLEDTGSNGERSTECCWTGCGGRGTHQRSIEGTEQVEERKENLLRSDMSEDSSL